MKRRRCIPIQVAVSILATFLFSCASSTDTAGTIDVSHSHPEAALTPGWLNVKTMLVHSAIEKPEPSDMIVRGTLSGWEFEPMGPVQGSLQRPPTPGRTRPVWLILRTREIKTREDGSPPPAEASLPGRFDPEDRLFYPSQAAVVGIAHR